ncbi:hypothetical protein DSM43519_05451 [Mycobacterium marinum]|nr:hypothetical protein CCUG20998_00182 [Mycobacterium marinum]RFZ15640.1 hypothetical protein DSM43519_05451 [Mycobacterium marinum]RFZ17148.1 hypothetical protein DSM44344_05540 [Mycobacterium marinum]RFZ33505.1 hypothetical protein NCTC2275_02741 [Mycobacterium marinum]
MNHMNQLIAAATGCVQPSVPGTPGARPATPDPNPASTPRRHRVRWPCSAGSLTRIMKRRR